MYDKTPADPPRGLYCVEVDLDRWEHGPAETRGWYPAAPGAFREPIFTLSEKQVDDIVQGFGKDYVRVRYAPLPQNLCWFDSEWPRKEPVALAPGGEELTCPHCGEDESIVEVDTHNAASRVYLYASGSEGVAAHASVEEEDTNRHLVAFMCEACGNEVTLDEPQWDVTH